MTKFNKWINASSPRAAFLAVIGLSVMAGGLYYTYGRDVSPAIPETIDEGIETVSRGEVDPGVHLDFDDRMVNLSLSLDLNQMRQMKRESKGNPEKKEQIRRYIEHMAMAGASHWATADKATQQQLLDMAIYGQEWYRRSMQDDASNANGRSVLDPESEAERLLAVQRAQYQMANGNAQQVAHVLEFFKALRERREEIGMDAFFLPKTN